MKLTVTPPVRALGIKVIWGRMSGAEISNKSRILERYKKEVTDALAANPDAQEDILEAYTYLYEDCEVSGFTPPAVHLRELLARNGRLPNINTAVDCYNLVSAQTGLSIGAHDTAFIEGDLVFKLTDGTEQYTPLGEEQPVAVKAGEYACCDEAKIICRLDVKQCNQTKVTKATRDFIVYVQGNVQTDLDYLQAALDRIGQLLTEICGGTFTPLPVEGQHLTPIETERMILRPISRRDLEGVVALYGDPDVMRYIGLGHTRNEHQSRKGLDWMIWHWEQHGFGMWAMLDKATGQFIGRGGLIYMDDTPEIEVGYALLKPYWGKGYATELTRAALQFGFEQLGLQRIVGITYPENTPSRHVLEKCGLIYEGIRHHYEVDVSYYAIERPNDQNLS